MSHCNQYGDPVDAALHAFGLCTCAVYQNRPPRRPWQRADIEHLLALMGWELQPSPHGGFHGHDPARMIFCPDPQLAGEPAERLDELIIRCACARSLAGRMTAAEARAILEPLGVTLVATHQGWRGWVWEVVHAASDWRSDAGFTLAGLVETARSHLRHLGYAPSQPVLTDLTTQTPKAVGRPEQRRADARPRLITGRPSGRRARPPGANPTPAVQLDVFTGGHQQPQPAPWCPAKERDV